MSIQAGLVGLPNVGKSTLFNALTKSSIPAENYPFCTIDPHTAITHVPDPRMDKLMAIYGSQKKIPAMVTFVDIAGLVKGAAEGQGLGNQFLGHIREVDLIIHVLRCFEDDRILREGGAGINPIADYEIIMAELMIKDSEAIEKRLPKVEATIKKMPTASPEHKEAVAEAALLKELAIAIGAGNAQQARTLMAAAKAPTIPLLSAKNFLVVANIAEHEIDNNEYEKNQHYQALVKQFGTERVVPICVKIEFELSRLPDEEAAEMMEMFGLKEKGINTIIRKTYENLGLITFFTCGPKEAHAWTIKKGTTVRKAAGEIHSDLDRGFICADVWNCVDLFALGSENAVKDQGKMRREGQDYIVRDGDIINVKFNV